MESLVRRVQMGATLQLPSVRLAAHAVETLEPGTLIRFGLSANTLAEWRVAGQQLALARAIRLDVRRAAHIESVVGVDQ